LDSLPGKKLRVNSGAWQVEIGVADIAPSRHASGIAERPPVQGQCPGELLQGIDASALEVGTLEYDHRHGSLYVDALYAGAGNGDGCKYLGGLFVCGLGSFSLILGVESPVYPDDLMSFPSLDSNLRFMGGLGIGLGLTLLWITPSIEKHTVLYRALWLCALAGGIGRFISAIVIGLPEIPMIVFAAIEVPGVPLLIYWQYKVASAAFGDC
jgi:hypothetical protein